MIFKPSQFFFLLAGLLILANSIIQLQNNKIHELEATCVEQPR